MSSDTKKAMMTNKCTSIAGHFDGHADALKRYEVHRLMQHDQGYTGSLCMLPSGDYSLHIAPVAARATITKQCKNAPSLLAISMDIAMRLLYRLHRTMEETHDFMRSHWTPPSGKYLLQ